MDLIKLSIRQPVTITVGVLLMVLAGIVALRRIPVQLTPNVEDTIVAVTTTWEGASPQEVEQEIVDEQEDKLQGLANLREMTSTSMQGVGNLRLEFQVGTDKEAALREVSDKLRQVPEYPDNVNEPVVEASDPENRDYIAWIILECSDPAVDVRELRDFAEDRIKPALERVSGISEVNVLGGREREVQVRYDAELLAQRGLSVAQLVDALRSTNQNFSGGEVAEDKSDVRVRVVGQYQSTEQIERTLVERTPAGPIYVRDVAEVVMTYKDPSTFVHSRGVPCLALNAQKEVGANLMAVMDGLKAALDELNRPGELLDSYATSQGYQGRLSLLQVYDQTIYIDDALELVQDNIWIGGLLAIGALLLFLRSLRSAGIIALSIPISVVGAIAAMVAMGRTINVISLAGMAFAVGMVVDNAIVVLENVYRHVEMGKHPMRAAYDGTKEVWGAVLASSLTTLVVFVPILLIQDEAGQLFRDISLAIVSAIALSMLVSITVVPCAAARLLKDRRRGTAGAHEANAAKLGFLARLVQAMGRSRLACLVVVTVFTALSVLGTWKLMPPSDYLPQGNRNLAFGMLIPPPGYSLEQREVLARRVEDVVRPYWEVGRFPRGSAEYEQHKSELGTVPTFDMRRMMPGEPVVPPPLENYFIVSIEGMMFHGGISAEPERVVDLLPLFQHAARAELHPGVLGFAFQVPLFQLGGRTGSAVKINFSGDDLDEVSAAALSVYGDLIGRYGMFSVQPDPSNFNILRPEFDVRADLLRLGEVGLAPAEFCLAVQTLGDGAVIGDFKVGGQSIDLKVIARQADPARHLAAIAETPLATPNAGTLPLASLASIQRTMVASQINRDSRRRAVTLQFTAPPGKALEAAIGEIDGLLAEHRARGSIPSAVATTTTGSASKLASVRSAMLGDGTLVGTLSSALALALIVVYLVMCVLFQSFVSPLIILFSVPLATVGGFAALRAVHDWSVRDPYMPVQNLDVLTMLGFVILIGVVVNNAILIVHQTLNFERGTADEQGADQQPLTRREAVARAVDTRVRPIFMTTLTSIGGLAPLVVMPGSGSELYRGLGAVVLGGLLCSTLFTLFLIPALLMLKPSRRTQERTQAAAQRASSGGGAAVFGAAQSLIVLVCALGLFGACAGPAAPGSSSASAAREAARWRSGLELSLEPAIVTLETDSALQGPAPKPPQGFDVEALERLGGPPAYEQAPTQLPSSLLGGAPPVLPLALVDALERAAQHNLGLRWERLGPEIAEQAVEAARGKFDLLLFSDLLVESTDEPRVVPVIGSVVLGSPAAQGDHQALEFGFEQLLSTGGTLSASALIDRSHDSTSGIDFSPDPAWNPLLSLSARQPLWRGGGARVNQADIELARNGERRAQAKLEAAILDLAARVQVRFWDLVEAWKALEIQEQLLESGEQVRQVLEQRQAFDATQTQYADALATVDERRALLVRARRTLARANDALKAELDDPEHPVGQETLFKPEATWNEAAPTIDLAQQIEWALERRPELRAVLLAIEDSELREALGRDAARYRLDLRAGVTLAGLDDELSEAFSDTVEADFPSAFVGLSLELPLGNRVGKAQRERARLESRQAALEYQRIATAIVVEVKAALRDVASAHELIAAARATRLARTENLRALLAEEQKRSALSPEFLALKFQRQQSLALAQAQEVAALADYQRAKALLARAVAEAP